MSSIITAALTLAALILIASAVFWRRRALPCPFWLAWLVELDNPFFRNNRASVIVEHLDLRAGMRALDVGCGPGRVAIPMARKVGPAGEVVAIDLQSAMLRKAQKKAGKAGLTNIRFEQAKAGAGELNFGLFDRAVLVTVLGEIPDRSAALKEIFQSLVPGGVLGITEVIADPHFQSRSSVRAVTAAVGFREKNMIGHRFSYSIYLKKPVS
jgi:ubiquinone/menaquinone biosynthesis C-methylase UbiE